MKVIELSQGDTVKASAQESFGPMRDCVRELARSGAQGKERVQAVKFIAAEFLRSGKDQEWATNFLLQWSKRCTPPIPLGLLDTDITKPVAKVYRGKMKLGCGSRGKLQCICFGGQRQCEFYEARKLEAEKARALYKEEAQNFYVYGWPEYLEENDHRGKEAVLVYKALKQKMVHECLTYQDTIYIGFRGIAELVRKMLGVGFNKNLAEEGVARLIGYGLIAKAFSGSANPRKGRANGYRITLPVPKLPQE